MNVVVIYMSNLLRKLPLATFRSPNVEIFVTMIDLKMSGDITIRVRSLMSCHLSGEVL